jgi:hypothetical protein
MKPIPRRDPEIIQAEADQRYHGNTDKVPTTSHAVAFTRSRI